MERVALLRRGLALEGVTVGSNALEGVVAIAAGVVCAWRPASGAGRSGRTRTRPLCVRGSRRRLFSVWV